MNPNFQKSRFSKNKSLTRVIWRGYFSFAVLGGIFALYLLLQRQSESRVFLLGLSPSRFILGGIILLATLTFGWLLLQSWFRPQWVEERLDRIASVLSSPSRWCIILVITGLLFLAGCYFITLVPEVTESFTRAYFVRLLPLVAWITGLSALSLVAIPILRYGSGFLEQRPRSKLFYTSLFIFIFLFFAWWWVSQTSLELEARRTGWNSLAAPILETQVLIAWLAGMFTLLFLTRIEKRSSQHNLLLWLKPQRIDLLIGLILWVTSIILWFNIPTHPNWFVSEPRPPNFENYPSSDAFVYDSSAQFLLVGEGFKSWTEPYVRRPIHTLYLAALHLVVGQNYDSVIFLQIVILALLPVLMYYMVKALYSRSAGVIAAVLIILREVNSIAIAGNITTSNVKLLMSDLPATIAVVGFVLIVITWFQNIEKKPLYPLIAGGALGIPVLIRFETAILLVPLGIVSALLFGLRKNLQFWLKNMLLFILGLMLVLTPWIWRNWRSTGLLFIDSPTHSYDLINLRYLQDPDAKKAWLPLIVDIKYNGEGSQTSAPTPISPQSSKPEDAVIPPDPSIPLDATPPPTDRNEQLTEFNIATSQQAIDLFKNDPPLYASVFMTHYLNSQIQTLLVLPTSFRVFESLTGFFGHKSLSTLQYECCSVIDYTRRMPYWRKWGGAIPREALIPLIVNLLLIAIGLNVAWRRNRLVGITPLIFAFTYILGNAIFRNSGGRYILPVDWISIPYFSIGLAYLSKKCVSKIANMDLAESLDSTSAPSLTTRSHSEINFLRSPRFYTISISLLLLGALLPIVEWTIKPQYTTDQKDQIVTSLMQSNLFSKSERQALETFDETNGYAILGRALYPRFFPANVGEIWSDNVFGPQTYTRVGFLLAGPESKAILMPVQERPDFFPNTSDVIVLKCPGPDMDALLIAILDDSGTPVSVIWRSPLPSSISCPLPAIESTTP